MNTRSALPSLALAALGVVFGDIATSPLYALQDALGAHGVSPLPETSWACCRSRCGR